jgi:hypothetical protein
MTIAHLPRARQGLVVQSFDQSAAVQVSAAHGEVCLLEGPEAQVMQALAQAHHHGWSAAQLAAHVGLGLEALWTVLDALADRGLLAQRATPPVQAERATPRTEGYLMGRRKLALMGLATAAAPLAMASTVADEQSAKQSAKATAPEAAQEEEAKLQARPKGEAEQKQAMKAQESKRKRSQEQDKKAKDADRLERTRASEETAKQAK